MPKLTIDTTASLYEPIEVEINGEKFAVRKLGRKLITEILELDQQVASGNIDAIYQRLELLIGEHSCIDDLDPGEVRRITEFIIEHVANPKRAEKNLPEPGDGKLPS